MERTKKYIRNKKQKFATNKTSKLSSCFTSILKLSLALALFFIAALFINASGVIVEDGALNVSNNLLVNTNTLFVDSVNNRVGIGMIPSFALDLIGTQVRFDSNADSTFNLYLDSGSTASQYSRIQFTDRSNARWQIGKTYGDDIYIWDQGATKYVFYSDYTTGNIGIGTTTPNMGLHVVGNQNLTGTLYYGALQAQSPHAFINNDAKSRTEICIVADDGVVVLQYLKKVGAKYEWVFEANAEECLNKEIVVGVNIEYEEVFDKNLNKTINKEISRTEIKKKVFR